MQTTLCFNQQDLIWRVGQILFLQEDSNKYFEGLMDAGLVGRWKQDEKKPRRRRNSKGILKRPLAVEWWTKGMVFLAGGGTLGAQSLIRNTQDVGTTHVTKEEMSDVFSRHIQKHILKCFESSTIRMAVEFKDWHKEQLLS